MDEQWEWYQTQLWGRECLWRFHNGVLKVLNGVMLLLDFDPKQFLLDILSFRGNQACHFNFFSMMMLGFLFCTLAGEKETELHMLRSILAQMKFCHIVRQSDDDGIPFIYTVKIGR